MLSGEFRKNLVSSTISGELILELSPLINTSVPLVFVMLPENVTVSPSRAVRSDDERLMVKGPAKALLLNRTMSRRMRNTILALINSPLLAGAGLPA